MNRATGKVAPCRMRRDLTVCPHGRRLVCTARHTENSRRSAADLPGLLRPRRPRRLERLGRRTLAPHHDHARPRSFGTWNAARGEAADLLRQGRRVPAPRRRPLPRPAPPRPRDPADPDAILAPPPGSPPPTSASSSPPPSPPPHSGRRTTPTPRTPGPSPGAPSSTSARCAPAPRSPTGYPTSAPRRSPPTWPSTPPRPPSPPGCRSRPDDRRDRRVLQPTPIPTSAG